MYTLALYSRIAETTTPNYVANITQVARGWRRSVRSVGGYWLGSFHLSGEDLSRVDLLQWFQEYLGNHIKEKTAGLLSWEGLICEMTLTLDGIQYRCTLDKERFQNRIKVMYRDAGVPAATAWAEDTASSDKYGENNYIDSISEATAAAAIALRDTRLADFAFPRPRIVGGLEFGSEAREQVLDTLQVTVMGYVFSINWRYRESSIVATAASTALADLVNDSEFVAEGSIDANSMNVDVDCATPQRLWDAIEDLVSLGDASNNRWVGGVYGDRKFNYNQASTAVGYFIRNGILVDLGGAQVIPSLLKPDFIVRNTTAPYGGTPIGGNIWDDPRNAWIAEVEFVAPDGLILKPAEFEDVQILKE